EEGLKAKQASLNQRIADLKKRLEKKPVTPAEPDVCATCPLMKEWGDIPKQIEQLERELGALESCVAAVELCDLTKRLNKWEIIDLEAIAQRGATARAAARNVASAKGSAQRLEEARNNLHDAEEKLVAHRVAKPDR